ncbi:ribonuclease H-like domain-containing protein [Tanacetum coccineum]
MVDLCEADGIKDKLTYLEHPIPVASVPAPEQVFPQDVLAAHATWVKASKEIRLNYNMHGIGKTANELHAMLKLHEQTLPKKMMPLRFMEGKTKIAYAPAYTPKPKIPPPPKKDNPAKDVICYQCDEECHWRMNCPEYLAELMKKKNLSQGASTSGLKGSRKLKPGALNLYVGNDHRAAVEAIGYFHLRLPSGLVVVLNNCLVYRWHWRRSLRSGLESTQLTEEELTAHLRLTDGPDFWSCLIDNKRVFSVSGMQNYVSEVQHQGRALISFWNKLVPGKGEYDIWAMKMEHYLAHTDYPIWEVIQNGNGPVSITTDTQGQIKVLPPRTVEEILAREKERKARTTLLMALPEIHLAKLHKITDAKEMWDAIASRFGGNDESKKMQKYILKQQFEGFSVSNSEGLHKGYDRFQSILSQLEIHGPGVDSLSFDDLYNNLRVFENDVKGSSASSSSTQNVAFVFENTSSTNDVSTAYSVSNTSCHKS